MISLVLIKIIKDFRSGKHVEIFMEVELSYSLPPY